MPPRKKRALQAQRKDEGLPVAGGTKSAPETAAGTQEEQEAMLVLGNGGTLPNAEYPDRLTAARLEELEQKNKRRTYVVHPGARVDFNRRETYVVSFNPVLEEDSASEEAVPETGTFFVGHKSDVQESPPKTMFVADQVTVEANVIEQKPRGRKKKEKNTSNPEESDITAESPKKRGRKKKMEVAVDQTATNITVDSPNIDDPILVDDIKDNDFVEEKKASKPTGKKLKALPSKKPEKRGRKKKNDLLIEQPMEDITEDASRIDNPVVMQSIDGSDSAENLLHQDNDEKTAQKLEEPAKSQDISKKKPVKRLKK